MKKTLKKIGCTLLAACSLAVGALSLTSCTTDRPEVQMQLSFNGETYTLYYTLYRKYAPNTVNHFLALAENGYYDGMCVHNYVAGTDMYTGAYEYDIAEEETGGLKYVPYFETVATYQNFPASVWTTKAQTTPTYTVYGEFNANGNFTVANGSFLRRSYGALTMYYTPKEEYIAQVEVQKVNTGELATRDYKYNSATSRFNISLKDRAYDSNYCTFATLNNPDALEALEDALAEYAENFEEGATFTNTVTVEVDTDDMFVKDEGGTETYNIPESPIVVEYVRVNKY